MPNNFQEVNKKFRPIYVKNWSAIYKIKMGDREKYILTYLFSYQNCPKIFPAYNTISSDLEISIDVIKKTLKNLVTLKFITIISNPGYSHIYEINYENIIEEIKKVLPKSFINTPEQKTLPTPSILHGGEGGILHGGEGGILHGGEGGKKHYEYYDPKIINNDDDGEKRTLSARTPPPPPSNAIGNITAEIQTAKQPKSVLKDEYRPSTSLIPIHPEIIEPRSKEREFRRNRIGLVKRIQRLITPVLSDGTIGKLEWFPNEFVTEFNFDRVLGAIEYKEDKREKLDISIGNSIEKFGNVIDRIYERKSQEYFEKQQKGKEDKKFITVIVPNEEVEVYNKRLLESDQPKSKTTATLEEFEAFRKKVAQGRK
jgi:predicted transcriptional regulator